MLTRTLRAPIRKWISKALVLGISSLLCYSAYCDTSGGDNPIEVAQALVDEGKADEAFTLLRSLQPQLEGEPAFDYVFGLAALDSGRTVEALFALERVVDAFPNHGPARAELARAYLALGETDDAKDQFEKVKEIDDLPPEAKQTIERYLTGIELFHDRTRFTLRPWLQIGFGYDTNVNGATDEKSLVVPIAPGLPFTLDGTANSSITNLGLGISVSKPIDSDLGLSAFGSAQLDARLALDEADFSARSGAGRLGLILEKEKHKFSLAADANMVRLDGGGLARGDRQIAGISAEWQHTPTAVDQVSAFFQASAVRHPEQSIRDINRAMAGLNFGHAFTKIRGSPILYSSAFVGIEDERVDGTADHFGRRFFGTRVGASYQLSERQTMFSTFTYQRSVYEGTDPVFLVGRRDNFFELNFGYRFQFDKRLSLSPTLIYNDNDSNIVTNDYDRFELMVTARFDF